MSTKLRYILFCKAPTNFMTNERPGRGFWRRVIIARILACVFVLQGVAFAVSREPASVGGLEAGMTVSMGEYCGADKLGDKGGPTHRDHSQCCILCSSSAYDGVVRFVSTLFVILSFPTHQVAAVKWRIHDDPVASPVGWTSSWSSRAPPSFS